MNQQQPHPVIHMAIVLLLLSTAVVSHAQTTAFTYQGRLSDGGNAANGPYDMQFALFDSLVGGAQVGSTQTVSSVSVSAGIFSVSLDFGASAFSGPSRWLEIRARLTGAPSFTTLVPRQQITSTPYAIRSLNAASADAVAVGGIPTGSANYIQNNPASPQGGNFNVSGNGTAGGTLSAGTVNATTQYNLGGVRLLWASMTGNLFAGLGAGESNTSGSSNSFFGNGAGQFNANGVGNSFFGNGAGNSNTSGQGNSAFGSTAGLQLSTGSKNSYFGSGAGLSGEGSNNTFIGVSSGFQNQGSDNSFFGFVTGIENLNGNRNTLLGAAAGVGLENLNNATAIGANARVDQSDSLVLGSIAGINSATASARVGIGTTSPLATLDTRGSMLVSGNTGIGTLTPQSRLHVVGSSWFQGDNTPLSPGAGKGIVMGFGGEQGYIQAFDYGPNEGKNLLLNNSGGNVGIGTAAPQATLDVNGAGVFRPAGPASPRATSFASPNGETGMTINGQTNRADVRFDSNALRLVAALGTSPPSATSGISITTSGNVGVGQTSPLAKLDVAGTLKVDSLAGGGDQSLCRNSTFNTIATCSSSLRYKKEIAPYRPGLDLINRLHPIAFSWKTNGARDLGFGAEDVAKVEPLLVTHNDYGQIEGVRYDRLNVVLVNAIKQQQEQIETLMSMNAALNKRLRAVESVVQKRGRVRHK